MKQLLLNCPPSNAHQEVYSLLMSELLTFLLPWPGIFSRFIHVKGHLFGPRPKLESIAVVAR